VRGLVIASFVVIAWGASARGDVAPSDDLLARAQAAVKASDYPGALAAITAAFASGKAISHDLAELYKLSGIVEAALGDTKAATTAFLKLLVLDGSAELPAGTSPKIVRPFEAARKKAKGLEAMAVDVAATADPLQVAITVTSDPLSMIVRARVYVSADGGAEHVLEDALDDGRVAIALPRARRLVLRVAMLDEHGNHVVERGTHDAPIVLLGPELPPPPPPKQVAVVAPSPKTSPLYRQPWAWTAAGAIALGGAGIGFGLAASSAAAQLRELNATSSDHFFSQAQAVQSRGDRDALLCNIGFAAAGAAALTSTMLYVIEHRSSRAEARITAAPAPGGVTLAIGGGW
jgi:hypothetical protein